MVKSLRDWPCWEGNISSRTPKFKDKGESRIRGYPAEACNYGELPWRSWAPQGDRCLGGEGIREEKHPSPDTLARGWSPKSLVFSLHPPINPQPVFLICQICPVIRGHWWTGNVSCNTHSRNRKDRSNGKQVPNWSSLMNTDMKILKIIKYN